MIPVDQAFLPRIARYSLGLGVACTIAAAVVDNVSAPALACAGSVSAGVPHLWSVSVPAIVLAWLGVVGGVVALAGGGQWLVGRLRDPGAATRWAFGGWALFLVVVLVVLALAAVNLDSFYANAVGRIVDCG